MTLMLERQLAADVDVAVVESARGSRLSPPRSPAKPHRGRVRPARRRARPLRPSLQVPQPVPGVARRHVAVGRAPLVAAPRRARGRLTKRGRLTVVALGAAFVLVAFLLGRASAVAPSAPAPPRAHAVVVRPGETVWQIAQRVAPGRDTRLVVRDLERENHLVNAVVVPGQRLVVPGR